MTDDDAGSELTWGATMSTESATETTMIQDRRKVERRVMPGEIRALVEELRAISRAPGSQTRDGTEWRTIRKGTVDLLVQALVRSWRPEDPDQRPGK